MQAFSQKCRDRAAAALQNRLSVRRARDSTGTPAHLSSSQRPPAELAARPPCAGRPLGASRLEAAKAASRALQLSTRRGTAWRLWLESDFDPGRYPRLLVALRAAISGFCGRRGRWTDRGRMVACGRIVDTARHRCRVAHCAYPERLGRCMCLVYVWNLLVQHSVASQEPQDVLRIYFPAV